MILLQLFGFILLSTSASHAAIDATRLYSLYHHSASSNNGAITNIHLLDQGCVCSHKDLIACDHSSAQSCTRRYMSAEPQYAIMLDCCIGINNTVIGQTGMNLNYCTRHNLTAFSHHRLRINKGVRVDQLSELKAFCFGLTK